MAALTPLEDRFWKFVDKSGGCWLWTGGRNRDGYGMVRVTDDLGRRMVQATRAALYLDSGSWPPPWPVGHILHSCDNPSCVRPDHLRVGTHAENMMDKVRSGNHHNASKTHCKRGHEFTPENTLSFKDRPGRMCIACRRIGARRRYAAAKLRSESDRA